MLEYPERRLMRNKGGLDDSCSCMVREKRAELMNVIMKEEAARTGHREDVTGRKRQVAGLSNYMVGSSIVTEKSALGRGSEEKWGVQF